MTNPPSIVPKTFTLHKSRIIVGKRMREDLGSEVELREIADSIKEVGLIHPLSVDEQGNLVAGGRRFHVLTNILGWDDVPVTLAEGCKDTKTLRMMELEENIRRKEMTWKEKVKSIAEVDRLHKLDAALKSFKWTQQMTSELLGISVGNVNYCLEVVRHLENLSHPIQKAESLTEALKILVELKQEEVAKFESSLMAEIKSSAQHQSLIGKGAELSIDKLLENVTQTELSGALAPSVADASSQTSSLSKKPIHVELSKYFTLGDSLQILSTQTEPESIDHIVTDLPYAIKMGMLSQSSTSLMDVSSVEDEHDVESNIELYHKFLPLAFRVLKENSFCVFWYDLDHKDLLQSLAINAGFKFCRWPLHWIKTHTCKNQAAQFNPTKAVEHAMILRKGNATLATPFGVNYWIGSNDNCTKEFDHLFAKPEGLWTWIVNAIAPRNSVILDPFAGCFSGPIAFAKAGYYPRGIECKELHFNKGILKFKELMTGWFPDKEVLFS